MSLINNEIMRNFKKWMLAAIRPLVLTMVFCGTTTVFTSCVAETDNPAPVNPENPQDGVTDYSKKASWCRIPEITKEFDTFYIPATNYTIGSYEEGAPDFASLDNEEMRAGIEDECEGHASVYATSTNVFVPYYRQAGLRYEEECWKNTGNMCTALTDTPYTDITAALDYYFENYNGGRPFIIAGHSQGSAMTKLVLMGYFKEHPDYYKRMIAAYVIGYAVTKDDLAANPHLKFATSDSDTGVIISWNTEGAANATAKNMVWMPGAISINPLNWKLDDTYAPASENLGSYMLDPNTLERKMTDVNADAQVNVDRGVVVTNANCATNPLDFVFGPASFHDNDYALFYNNLLVNVATRILAYQIQDRAITDDNYDKSLAVKCINGTFVGQKTDNVISFKGIPYVGQQPVGGLRWKAPVDYTANDGVYEAYYYGKSSIQADGDPAALYIQGEDCLYLNIWKAASKQEQNQARLNSAEREQARLEGKADDATTEKKPVIVWIHGGGFETGGTIDPMYDCDNFIKENPDVIVVTLNYRLAPYGFLHLSHLPDGKDYPDAQNLGLLDQQMALKWVHENIEGFGGDPDNVTIWGESAGGASCTLQPLLKGSQKYFKRVIAQSGTPIMTRSTEEAIAVTDSIMKELGCKTVADLQRVTPEKLASTIGRLYGIYQVLGWRIWPERDGRILPLDTWKAYEDGAAKDIAFLQGCNADEMNTFAAPKGFEVWNNWAADRMAKKSKLMTDEENAKVESYLNSASGEDWQKTSSLFSQSYWNAPTIRLSENQTIAGGKVYTYLFTPESSVPNVKSGHAIELPAVFDHPEQSGLSGRAFDPTFCKIMRKMWVQFAKTGNPSLSADISPDGKAYEWPLYDLGDKQVMVLDEFNIHPAKESEVKIVDWENTYFLTKYYCQ